MSESHLVGLRPGDIIMKLMAPGPYLVLDSFTEQDGVRISCQHLREGDYQHFCGYLYTPCGRLVYPSGMGHLPGPLDEVFVIGHQGLQMSLFEEVA